MTLLIDNAVIETVQAATLSLVIKTEDWAPAKRTLFGRQTHAWLYGTAFARAFWSLDIVVDEESGADGAPAPSLWMPIEGQAFPARLGQISGMRLIATDATEAWFGNDAPRLEKSVLEFGDWLGDASVFVRWTAEYDWGVRRPERLPFCFEGAVTFSGIQMQVKREADATTFLSHVLPGLDQSLLDMTLGRQIDYGGHMPADRRHWREVFWRSKP